MKKSRDREAGEETTSYFAIILANLLIALSGFILYSDKAMSFFAIEFAIPEKWQKVGMDFQTFVWFVSQTFSPVIWALGTYIHRKTFMHFVPIYCYALQFNFIFRDYDIVDDADLNYYVWGSTFITLLGFHGINWLLRRRVKKNIRKIRTKILENGERVA